MADDTNNVNTATTNPDGNETNSPQTIHTGDGLLVGKPTMPGLSRGVIANTWIANTNSAIAHACDFATEMQKNNELKKFLNSQANTIREAKRDIMLALGVSDSTGQFQWLKDDLQAVTRELKRFNKEVLQPIIEFEKVAIEYVKQIQAMIAWIASLPARILSMLADCSAKLVKLLTSVMTDSSGPSTNVPGSSDVTSVLADAKAAAAAVSQTITTTVKAATGAVAVVAVAASTVPSVGTINKKGP